MIFLACDEIAQNLLSPAEKAGQVKLSGDADDTDRSKMVEDVILIIAKDNPTEKVRQELDLLTTVQTCVRKGDERPAEVVNRFKGAISRYVNHTAGIDESTSRQFAVMLIRNA